MQGAQGENLLLGMGRWYYGMRRGMGRWYYGVGVLTWDEEGMGVQWGFWGRTALQNGPSSHKLGNVPAN